MPVPGASRAHNWKAETLYTIHKWHTVIIMVLELYSTQKVHIQYLHWRARSCNAMPCRKKALHRLIKCSYFKQQTLLIVLLNSTAMETFRLNIAAAVHSDTDVKSPLFVCSSPATEKWLLISSFAFLFLFKRCSLKKKKNKNGLRGSSWWQFGTISPETKREASIKAKL